MTHISITGDSQVILHQVAGGNATLEPDLQHAVTRRRRALRLLPSDDVMHTRRDGNKMADHLANVAMDMRQTTTGPTADDTTTRNNQEYVPDDTTHPRSAITPHHHLLPRYAPL